MKVVHKMIKLSCTLQRQVGDIIIISVSFLQTVLSKMIAEVIERMDIDMPRLKIIEIIT